MTLSPAERVVICGPSGSGKTVLLRVISMLDPFQQGEILWRGQAITDAIVPRFRAHVIYLHQRAPLIDGTVSDNLQLPFQLQEHRHRRYSEEHALAWLQQVDRDRPFLGRSTRDLSGGERQVVSLLRAIQLEPQVLLLDEPTSAADRSMVAGIEQLVRHWLEQSSERALIWVTHDTAQAERIGHRRLFMSRGELMETLDR